MSALSEGRAREEARRLRPMPAPPQTKPSKHEEELEGRLREAQPVPEAATRAVETLGEHRTPLRVLQKPPLAKPQLTPRKLREMLRSLEPSRLGLIQIEGRAGAVLKPKPLRVQTPGTLKPGEPHASVREQLRERPVLSPKPLKCIIPEVIASRPVVRPPSLALKPLQPRTLRPGPPEVEEGEASASFERGAGSERATEEVATKAEERVGEALLKTEEELVEIKGLTLPQFVCALSEVAESSGRPVVVIVPRVEGDSFVSAVAITCREIYRVVKGGKPEPRWISVSSMKEEIEQYLSAGDRIFVIDDPEGRMFNASRVQTAESREARINLKMLVDRLRELFSQDLGFVIFHVSEQIADGVYETLRGLHLGARIIKVEPPLGWSLEDRKRFIEACWGFVDVRGQSFDGMFREAEEKFYDLLEKAGKNITVAHWVKQDESAGEEHECMKVFTAECLARELGCKSIDEIVEALKSGFVITEHGFSGGRADIYVPSQQRFVEVETFYGTGDPIIKKLDKATLSRYIDQAKRGAVKRVDVVLLNGLLAILYARRLTELARFYREHYGIAVDFYVPSFREKRLVPLREVLSLLRGLPGASRARTDCVR
jgi:flavodoxin